jgi:hypothetical protein
VAPWVWQYRQAVKEVVRYGGEGDRLAHLIKAEFGAAVRKAYFGPEVEDLPFGEWPMEFEGRERRALFKGPVSRLLLSLERCRSNFGGLASGYWNAYGGNKRAFSEVGW